MAVQAARKSLYAAAYPGEYQTQADWASSAIAAMKCSLPHAALGRSIDPLHLLAAHRHAWQIANLDELDPLHTVLSIKNPLNRALKAFELEEAFSPARLGELAIEAVEKVQPDGHKPMTALAFYLALRGKPATPIHVLETLSRPLSRWLNDEKTFAPVWKSQKKIIEEVVLSLPSDADRDDFAKLVVPMMKDFRVAETKPALEHFLKLWHALRLNERTYWGPSAG